jgi:hypothetical protein
VPAQARFLGWFRARRFGPGGRRVPAGGANARSACTGRLFAAGGCERALRRGTSGEQIFGEVFSARTRESLLGSGPAPVGHSSWFGRGEDERRRNPHDWTPAVRGVLSGSPALSA